MTGKVLRLDGVTAEGRHEMIGRVKEAISAGGGDILDFHQFSNVSLCLNFEIAAARLGTLRAALARTGLRLSGESLDALAAACGAARREGGRPPAEGLAATLAITFVHDEPDLRIEVPPIPG